VGQLTTPGERDRICLCPRRLALDLHRMNEDRTTVAIQRYLNELGDAGSDCRAEPIIGSLLGRAVHRLEGLCGHLLFHSYPRLARPPLNLQPEEMLSLVVERLLKAMREYRPQTVRQFFALANKHMRWELNDLARRLDKQSPMFELRDSFAAQSHASDDSHPSAEIGKILDAIETLPDEEREVFSLIRIQGMTQTEAAQTIGVSAKTVQRRLNRSLVLLAEKLRVDAPSLPSSPP
jgi:RNA polymerase sigma factor (sigma-70 family)